MNKRTKSKKGFSESSLLLTCKQVNFIMPDPLPVIRCNCLLLNFITIIFVFLQCLLYHHVNAQVLNPPYFNLAEGRNVSFDLSLICYLVF